MILVTITRAELERHGACADGLALFDELARRQGEITGRLALGYLQPKPVTP